MQPKNFLDTNRREDDIEVVKYDSVVKILEQPSENRGILNFATPCY